MQPLTTADDVARLQAEYDAAGEGAGALMTKLDEALSEAGLLLSWHVTSPSQSTLDQAIAAASEAAALLDTFEGVADRRQGAREALNAAREARP